MNAKASLADGRMARDPHPLTQLSFEEACCLVSDLIDRCKMLEQTVDSIKHGTEED